MTIDLTQIIIAFITLVFGIIARYLIPWLIANTEDKKRAKIADMVDIAVEAADRYLKSATGAERKEYVVKYLEERGYTVDIENIYGEWNTLIESAVERLRIKQNANAAKNPEG